MAVQGPSLAWTLGMEAQVSYYFLSPPEYVFPSQRVARAAGVRMDQKSLKRWQLQRISDAIGTSLRYLGRLRRRMERTGFLGSDPLYQLVRKAEVDLQDLCMALHYLACESGVGRKPNKS